MQMRHEMGDGFCCWRQGGAWGKGESVSMWMDVADFCPPLVTALPCTDDIIFEILRRFAVFLIAHGEEISAEALSNPRNLIPRLKSTIWFNFSPERWSQTKLSLFGFWLLAFRSHRTPLSQRDVLLAYMDDSSTFLSPPETFNYFD